MNNNSPNNVAGEEWREDFKKFVAKDSEYGNEWTPVFTSKVKSFISQKIQEAIAAERERIEKIIGEHNARILNEFQLQGTPDIPFIAYDERVCLIPAIEKAMKETLDSLTPSPNTSKSSQCNDCFDGDHPKCSKGQCGCNHNSLQ